MEKNIFIILLLFAFFDLKSQNISRLVFDKASKKGIPYVSVWLKNSTIGTYSNEQGLFNLDLKAAQNGKNSDTLVLSCIGYKDFYYNILLNKKDTIYLDATEEILSEVVVKGSKNPQKYTVGHHKAKAKSGIRGSNGSIVVVFVPNTTNSEKRIINVIIPFRKVQDIEDVYFTDVKETHKILHKGEGRFRLKLYHKSTSEMLPDKEFLISNKIYHVDNYKKNIIINLENENIFMPKEGIFAGVEWLDTNTTTKLLKGTKPHLKCTHQIKENLTFSKWHFRSNKNWESHSLAMLEYYKAMNLPIKTHNLMIGFNLSD